MRVVAGELRGRRIQAPEGLDTRPTTDRVREAVFNALASQDLILGASVVDLFAGTGALGIEALSRGAASCRFVERDSRALRVLRQNIVDLGLSDRATVVAAEALADARGMPAADLVLADPPYGFDGWPELLGAVRSDLVVAETGRSFEPPAGWEIQRERRYGRTLVVFLERVRALP